jgi:PIN domain nuclease of toxin-antitoxin system
MICLLDTHIYLWMRTEPGLLSKRAAALLEDGSVDILISPVTPWELAIKAGAGRLNPGSLLHNFEQREVASGFRIAEITVAQTIASGLLPRHHRDPFDRLLIAQALDLGVPFISKDETFDHYGVQRIWD